MKQGSILSRGVVAVFCLGLLACSPEYGSTPDADSVSGGKGGSAGSGGSSAKGGSGGSNAGGSGGKGGSQAGGSQAGGSQSGGAQSGGSQAGGSQSGGAQSGGSQAGGSQAGGSQSGGAPAGGSGGNGGTGGTEDGGSTQPLDGGPLDVSGGDAEDAPLPDTDGASAETSGSEDSGVALDGGSVDLAPPDSAVAVDVESDTTTFDVLADTAEDTSPDAALGDADAGNCLEQIIGGDYSVGDLACSQCKESAGQQNSLEAQCKTMIDCLEAASCTNKNNPNNCFLGCQNLVSGGSQPETGACVADLMDAAQCPTQ